MANKLTYTIDYADVGSDLTGVKCYYSEVI